VPNKDAADRQPASGAGGSGRTERSPAERAADHSAISASIQELLPALIAKLGATGLAELEIREDALRVRIRRPTDGVVTHDRRAGDRGGRADRTGRGHLGSASAAQPALAPATIYVSGLTPVGPGRDGRPDPARETREIREIRPSRDAGSVDEARTVATSPAVGIYHPRPEARAGIRVRAGDRLGTVDMLGVPQEVVAPMDGLVGASLVEPGDAVEYGQDLVVIEFATAGSASGPAGGQDG
jgi:biotin carboxyl carrier protein